MAIRIVTLEYEAKLAPVNGRSGSGKVEHKTYDDGNEAMRARYRENGGGASELELFIKERSVGILKQSKKRAELDLDSCNGDTVPEVRPAIMSSFGPALMSSPQANSPRTDTFIF